VATGGRRALSAASTPRRPGYDLATVESAVLQVAAELHPPHLTADDLALEIVSDPGDDREVGTAAEAIRDLRGSACSATGRTRP
jgi:hypothetical protein